jgi:hypothetical protein
VQAHGSLAPDGGYLVYSQVTKTSSSIKSIDLTSKETVVLSGDYSWSMVPNVSPKERRLPLPATMMDGIIFTQCIKMVAR